MPKVATAAELLALGRDLGALRDELAIAATTVEIDMLLAKYEEVGVFRRLKPAARELLSQIIARRIAEIEAAESCSDRGAFDAAMTEYNERSRLLAMARTMGR
jgi:hypothetical protein